MDKIEVQIGKVLFEAFGLCPEYAIQVTNLEWIEIYRPFKMTSIVEDASDFFEPLKVRFNLNRHKVEIDGNWISSNFAVDHISKTIFVRVTEIDGGSYFYTVQPYG